MAVAMGELDCDFKCSDVMHSFCGIKRTGCMFSRESFKDIQGSG